MAVGTENWDLISFSYRKNRIREEVVCRERDRQTWADKEGKMRDESIDTASPSPNGIFFSLKLHLLKVL